MQSVVWKKAVLVLFLQECKTLYWTSCLRNSYRLNMQANGWSLRKVLRRHETLAIKGNVYTVLIKEVDAQRPKKFLATILRRSKTLIFIMA